MPPLSCFSLRGLKLACALDHWLTLGGEKHTGLKKPTPENTSTREEAIIWLKKLSNLVDSSIKHTISAAGHRYQVNTYDHKLRSYA